MCFSGSYLNAREVYKTDHERTVGVLECGMSCQDGVVWLNDGVRESGGRVYTELEFGLLAVVGRKTFKNESTETGTSSTTERVEDKEALKTVTVVGQTAQAVHDVINLLLSDGVVATGIWGERVDKYNSGRAIKSREHPQLLAASSSVVHRNP